MVDKVSQMDAKKNSANNYSCGRRREGRARYLYQDLLTRDYVNVLSSTCFCSTPTSQISNWRLRPVLYLEIRPKKGAEKGRINARLISLITDFRLIFGQFLCGIRPSNFTRNSLESKRGSDVTLPYITPEYFYTTVPGIAIVTTEYSE